MGTAFIVLDFTVFLISKTAIKCAGLTLCMEGGFFAVLLFDVLFSGA